MEEEKVSPPPLQGLGSPPPTPVAVEAHLLMQGALRDSGPTLVCVCAAARVPAWATCATAPG
jgi:hypothetical protein